MSRTASYSRRWQFSGMYMTFIDQIEGFRDPFISQTTIMIHQKLVACTRWLYYVEFHLYLPLNYEIVYLA